ncbi:uncharacterized protein METZ01_LOCUS132778 [marine metagenome]|jgi:putative oxidoreductase|uniref:DoxX family protein n=1 Tax=marine metagenome TaxID=408172 RepID=A0A381YSJ2_9ZZZZ|tara:strand:- start:540 stop:1007 length:468 start_codon:yes stop_codon:yes gene_type:complete
MLNELKKNILKYLLILMRLGNSSDIGILILRVFSGATMFMNHGINKISAGTIKWERVGSALTDLIGFESLKIFFGFMASFAESIGAIFIMIGFLTRFSSSLLFFTMLVASLKHYLEGDFSELAFIYALICFTLIISGSGHYSVDNILKKKISNNS